MNLLPLRRQIDELKILHDRRALAFAQPIEVTMAQELQTLPALLGAVTTELNNTAGSLATRIRAAQARGLKAMSRATTAVANHESAVSEIETFADEMEKQLGGNGGPALDPLAASPAPSATSQNSAASQAPPSDPGTSAAATVHPTAPMKPGGL